MDLGRSLIKKYRAEPIGRSASGAPLQYMGSSIKYGRRRKHDYISIVEASEHAGATLQPSTVERNIFLQKQQRSAYALAVAGSGALDHV